EPVSLDVPQISAGLWLQLMLEQNNLDYVVRDEVLQITTPEDAENQLVTRIYDARAVSATLLTERQLRDIVEKVVQPRTWSNRHGRDSIDSYRGFLVESQSQEVQRDAERLITALDRHCASKEERSAENAEPIRMEYDARVTHVEAILAKNVSV